jgi:hypothetical protein
LAVRREPVIQALEDLSGLVSGQFARLLELRTSLPREIDDVKSDLESSEEKRIKTKPPKTDAPRV